MTWLCDPCDGGGGMPGVCNVRLLPRARRPTQQSLVCVCDVSDEAAWKKSHRKKMPVKISGGRCGSCGGSAGSLLSRAMRPQSVYTMRSAKRWARRRRRWSIARLALTCAVGGWEKRKVLGVEPAETGRCAFFSALPCTTLCGLRELEEVRWKMRWKRRRSTSALFVSLQIASAFFPVL